MNEQPNQPTNSPNQTPDFDPAPNPEASLPQDVQPTPAAYVPPVETPNPRPIPSNQEEITAPPSSSSVGHTVSMSQIQPDETISNLPVPQKSIFSLKVIIASILILIILTVIGVTAYVALPSLLSKTNSGSPVAESCTPIGGSLDDITAKKAFTNFVAAVKKSDQGCVDQQSTNVLKKVESQTYATEDGNWINKATELRSAVDDIKSLPNEFDAAKLVAKEYTRSDYSAYEGLKDSGTASGITVKYPLKSTGKTAMNIAISFVTEGNKILADSIQSAPEGFGDF